MSPPDSKRISSTPGKLRLEIVARSDVERRIFADHGMWTGPGFDRRNPRRIDQAGAAQAFGILPGDEVVGHDGKIDAAALQHRDQRLDQRGLAGADRPADADPRGGARALAAIALAVYDCAAWCHLSM